MNASHEEVAPETVSFYRQTLLALKEADVSFLGAGAHALERYTGIGRYTKDLDLFIRPADLDRTLETLAEAGYETEVRFSHWLAKAHGDEGDLDLIFGSGDGLYEIDESWFAHASEHDVFGVSIQLCPPEEMIWSKGFIMERKRYDGSDVAHLLYSCAGQIDWDHLIERFGPYWRVLLSHFILFGFIYPSERDRIPNRVIDELLHRLQEEEQHTPSRDRICRGTLLSRTQYTTDVEQRGFQDARLQPNGTLTEEQVERLREDVEENEQ